MHLQTDTLTYVGTSQRLIADAAAATDFPVGGVLFSVLLRLTTAVSAAAARRGIG